MLRTPLPPTRTCAWRGGEKMHGTKLLRRRFFLQCPQRGRCGLSSAIEDYALIGDCHTAALVSRGGSIDWLCWPAFDSDACFAALLGNEQNGRWKIAPKAKQFDIRRRYQPGTLILETTFSTDDGEAVLLDFM